MAFEDTKQLLGLGGQWRRYIREEDIADLADISDPTTLDDETQTSWREWVGQNAPLVVAGSLFLTIGLVLLVWQASRFLPLLIHNIYVQATAAAGTILMFGMYLGWNRRRSVVEHHSRLDLVQDDGLTPFYGTHIKRANGANLFIPMKGLTRSKQSVRPYKVTELSSQLPRQMHAVGMSDDAPVRIQLHPQYEKSAKTDLGTVATVRSGRLKPVQDGEGAVLQTTIPDYDDDEMDELARELEEKAQEVTRWRQRYEDLRREFQNFREDLDKPVDERVEKILDHTKELQMVRHGHGRQQQNGQRSGSGSVPPNAFDLDGYDYRGPGAAATPAVAVDGESGDDIMDQVEEEVTPDEEGDDA